MNGEQGAPSSFTTDDARLESLGYEPQLHRVLGFFANFAVAFTYLSPHVAGHLHDEREPTGAELHG